MAQDQWVETLYSFRMEGKYLCISKWAGGKQPIDQMTISNRGRGACSCFGALRNPQCKHKVMWSKVSRLNIPLMGSFYDYDHDILYTPEDGEGVPLNGAVDIWGLSIAQGVPY